MKAQAFDGELSSYCDGPERDEMRQALLKAERLLTQGAAITEEETHDA